MSIPTRLLDTKTGEFVVKVETDRPRYAILSHVWNGEGEQSYRSTREIQHSFQQQLQTTQSHSAGRNARTQLPQTHHARVEVKLCLDHPKMSEKIRRACAVARAHGYRYIWIDSCCIDKTSSTELSEAINSMFAWYRNAAVCYAFLADVRSDQDPIDWRSDFRGSRWFTRGWTLQELLAPAAIVFLAKDWQVIGTKSSLGEAIQKTTTIPTSVLFYTTPLRAISVAQRMSWASTRKTTRVEDEAYSLMGIFDINMPTLYGEGKRAFVRLQEEILKRIPDQTLFAWGRRVKLRRYHETSPYFRDNPAGEDTFFATSVKDFYSCGNVSPQDHAWLASRLQLQSGLPLPVYTSTSYGVHVRLPLLPCEHLVPAEYSTSSAHFYLAILACSLFDGSLVAAVSYTAANSVPSADDSSGLPLHSVVLTQEDLHTIHGKVRLMDVYLKPGYFRNTIPWWLPGAHKEERIYLAPWSREPLSRAGYSVARSLPVPPTDRIRSLILHDGEFYIKIDIRPWAMSAQVLWLDSRAAIGQVDTRHLRKLATVNVPGGFSSRSEQNISGSSTASCTFQRGPGVADTCTVTVTYSSEVCLWTLDVAFSPDSRQHEQTVARLEA